METRYEIVLQMRQGNQLVPYGSFQLGRDKGFAVNLFIALRGTANRHPDSIISAELIKLTADQKSTLASIHCSYLQLGENVKLITRELFKQLNLKAADLAKLKLLKNSETRSA